MELLTHLLSIFIFILFLYFCMHRHFCRRTDTFPNPEIVFTRIAHLINCQLKFRKCIAKFNQILSAENLNCTKIALNF